MMQPSATVARREWRWAATFSIFVMALTTAPYGFGWAAAGDEWVFTGFVFGVEDGNSYIAKMLRGAHGAWLFQLSYSSEPHPPALLFPFHILLGKITGALGGTGDALRLHAGLIVAYHIARIAGGVALLAASYRFLAELLPSVRLRRIGLLLVALGGGLGWLLVALGAADLPLDFYSPEAFTFLNLYGLPHLSLARTFMLLGIVAFWRSHSARNIESHHAGAKAQRNKKNLRAFASSWLNRSALTAGLLWLITALLQPFYVVIIYLLLGLFVAWTALHSRERAAILKSVSSAIGAVLPSLPIVVYTALLFQLDPIYRQWSRQNLILSPPWQQYLAAWGLLLAPALFGLRALWRRHTVAARWISGWLLVLPILLYLPLNLQRRTSEAIQVPLVGMALLGLGVGVPRQQAAPGRRARARWGSPVLITLLLPTPLLLLAGGAVRAARAAVPLHVPRAQAEVSACLGGQLPFAATVVSTFEVGNALPAFAPLTAYIGHGPETAFLTDKRPLVDQLFDAETQADERLALWVATGAAALLIDSDESPLAAAQFAQLEKQDQIELLCASDNFRAYTLREDR